MRIQPAACFVSLQKPQRSAWQGCLAPCSRLNRRKQLLRLPNSLLAIATTLLSVGLTHADTTKVAIVDLLLQREKVGQVVIDDQRGMAYFEKVVAPDGVDSPLPYTYYTFFEKALKRLYAAPLEGNARAQPLFVQEDGYGYFFPGRAPLSPDGRHLAVYRLKDRRFEVGVYDLQTSSVRFLGVMAGAESPVSEFAWLSDTALALTIEKVAGETFFPVVNRARALAAARESAWEKREVTAEVVGAGRYAAATAQEASNLVKIDIRTGEVSKLTSDESGVHDAEMEKASAAHSAVRQERRRAIEGVASDSKGFAQPADGADLLAYTDKGAVFIVHDYESGSRLVYVTAEDDAPTRLLHQFNEHLAGVSPAVGPIRIDHKDFEGRDVVSWLYLPPAAVRDNPEPRATVVIPYAGEVYSELPPDRHEWSFASTIWELSLSTNTVMEVFAANGYAVLLPSIPLNRAPGEPMREMMPAILSALDGAIATGFVDPERVALSGQSYGGYTALSVAVQTDRFDAIIAMASVSNLISQYGQFASVGQVSVGGSRTPVGMVLAQHIVSGIGRMGDEPWRDPERYVRNSPLFHVDKARTPVMLIHGDVEPTSLLGQAEEMFTGLRRAGKDVLFVKYFGEEHVVIQPQNQRDMWIRIFDFLEDNGVVPGGRIIH